MISIILNLLNRIVLYIYIFLLSFNFSYSSFLDSLSYFLFYPIKRCLNSNNLNRRIQNFDINSLSNEQNKDQIDNYNTIYSLENIYNSKFKIFKLPFYKNLSCSFFRKLFQPFYNLNNIIYKSNTIIESLEPKIENISNSLEDSLKKMNSMATKFDNSSDKILLDIESKLENFNDLIDNIAFRFKTFIEYYQDINNKLYNNKIYIQSFLALFIVFKYYNYLYSFQDLDIMFNQLYFDNNYFIDSSINKLLLQSGVINSDNIKYVDVCRECISNQWNYPIFNFYGYDSSIKYVMINNLSNELNVKSYVLNIKNLNENSFNTFKDYILNLNNFILNKYILVLKYNSIDYNTNLFNDLLSIIDRSKVIVILDSYNQYSFANYNVDCNLSKDLMIKFINNYISNLIKYYYDINDKNRFIKSYSYFKNNSIINLIKKNNINIKNCFDLKQFLDDINLSFL
jgi:hypothetical protein